MSLSQAALDALCRATPPECGDVVPDEGLADALDRCIARGAAAWPSLSLSAEVFAAWIGARLPAGVAPGVAVDELAAADLFLACACARGDARAIEALEDHHGAALRGALSRVRDPHLQLDDLVQIVRHRLLVGDHGAEPVITRYSGQGALGAWLRVMGVRTALNATRRKQPVLGERHDIAEQMHQVAGQIDDPELGYMRQRYQAQFREAFAEAASSLSSRERNLLRQGFVHGLGVRELGSMYGVHYATASRWLAQARERLVTLTHQRLCGRLEISEGELHSIMRLIRSDLHITLGRLLATDQ